MYVRLKELRDSLGLTQAEFGKSIGIAKSTYNNYETGIRDPKSDFWIAVAQKYGVTIDYLMGFSDNPHPTETKNSPNTDKSALGDEQKKSVMNLVSELTADQQEFLLAWLQTTIELRKQKHPSQQE